MMCKKDILLILQQSSAIPLVDISVVMNTIRLQMTLFTNKLAIYFALTDK